MDGEVKVGIGAEKVAILWGVGMGWCMENVCGMEVVICVGTVGGVVGLANSSKVMADANCCCISKKLCSVDCIFWSIGLCMGTRGFV